MNRFAKGSSILFMVLTWVFAGALFADGANLDDLFPSNLVIHDDEDVVSAAAMESTVWSASTSSSGTHSVRQDPVKGAASRQDRDSIPGRVVVDQDSPSLAAEHLIGNIFTATISQGETKAAQELILFTGELHLRFCSLLI